MSVVRDVEEPKAESGAVAGRGLKSPAEENIADLGTSCAFRKDVVDV